MDPIAAKYIGAGIACIGMGGAGAGVGIIFGNYLAAAVRNPPGDDMPAKISAIGQVCGDLPAWVFSLAAQTEAMRQWQWWPAAADVHALLVELSADDLATIAALRRVATTDPPLRYIPAPERPPPTEASSPRR